MRASAPPHASKSSSGARLGYHFHSFPAIETLRIHTIYFHSFMDTFSSDSKKDCSTRCLERLLHACKNLMSDSESVLFRLFILLETFYFTSLIWIKTGNSLITLVNKHADTDWVTDICHVKSIQQFYGQSNWCILYRIYFSM